MLRLLARAESAGAFLLAPFRLAVWLRVRRLTSGCAPPYSSDPSIWPTGDQTDPRIPNCYTWALDRPQEGWLKPGHLRGRQERAWQPLLDILYNWEAPTPRRLERALRADGLTRVGWGSSVPDQGAGWLVALYVAPDADDVTLWHFAREDAGGTWSDKPGLTEPRSIGRTLPFVINTPDLPTQVFRSMWRVNPRDITPDRLPD